MFVGLVIGIISTFNIVHIVIDEICKQQYHKEVQIIKKMFFTLAKLFQNKNKGKQ